MALTKLPESDVAARLAQLNGWKRQGDAITKTFTLPSFAKAVALVNKVAEHADRVDHHPDMLIQYRNLTFTLSTHDAGGLTGRDFDLAQAIEGLATQA